MTKLKLSGCGGLMMAPLLVLILTAPMALIWGSCWSLGYRLLLVPMMESIGYVLPAVPWAFWFCAYVLYAAFRGAFGKPGSCKTVEEMAEIYGSKIFTALMLMLMVWLTNLVIY